MPLPTSSPSAQHVDARGVLDLVTALEAEGHDPHSIVLARHGHVIARGWWAPYSSERVQLVYSLSKTFTATAVGLLVDEGRLRLEDPVLGLLPRGDLAEGVEVPERYRRLTLGQCLQMATGHDTDAWTGSVTAAAWSIPTGAEDPVLTAILAHPPEHEPGTAWAYNQVATYLAAGAVRGATGGSVLSLLRERAFPVLDPEGAERLGWHRTITGRELGFSGLHVGSDAILALTQTYLGQGELDGQRLLSSQWVATATAPSGLPNREESPNPDWAQGYGCSFWHARHGFRGDGAYGQYAIVLPEQDIALAITSETLDMQAVLDLVWTHLLPAVDRDGDASAGAELATHLGQLQVPTPTSTGAGPDEASWTRSADSTLPEAYGAVRLTRAAEGADAAYELVLEAHGGEVVVPLGDGTWVDSAPELQGIVLPFAGAGGWAQDGTFAADLRFIETPHTIRVRTRTDGTVHLAWREVPLQGHEPLHLAFRGAGAPPQA